MKITYISHATLKIEIGNLKIVTDPWVRGTAYCDQWHLFPKAIEPNLITDADVVLYSHGHEDHLHPYSLQLINKNAHFFYPYSWYDGTAAFFIQMGFRNIHEVKNEQEIQLAEGVKVTYFANNLDSIIVIEAEGKVLVNINDALPSASQAMIKHLVQKIKARWPKIDYVFSSYAGASYFPNTVHAPFKNDVEIAEARELFFLTNFFKIIIDLSPQIAVPFASDFILLDDNQRWINNIKPPRYKIKELFQNYASQSKIQIAEAYPGDIFERGVFFKKSPYHEKATTLLDTIDSDYAIEIAKKRKIDYLSISDSNALITRIKQHITDKQYIVPAEVRDNLKFSIKITDALEDNILTVDFRQAKVQFTISRILPDDIDLLIEIKSKIILHSIDNEWGGDAIIIGYGAEIFVQNQDVVQLEYENYCVRLLSRYPNTKEYLKRAPMRTVKYLLSDSIKRNNLLYKVVGQKNKVIDYFDNRLNQRDLWLGKSKCEVCKACNI